MLLNPALLHFTAKAANENKYPVCYGKFTTSNDVTEYQPVIIHKKTVYVNMWEFSSLLSYRADSYQNYLDKINDNLLKQLKNKEITSSFYSRTITSIADEAEENINSVDDELNFFSDVFGFLNKSAEKIIDNAISEANDTYMLNRQDSESYGGISWYIDIGSKKISAKAGNKNIVTYSLKSEILSSPPTKENNNDMDDVWIPFDALCQMFGCSWYINDSAIHLGSSMPYAEEFIFNDYSSFACNPSDFINGYASMSGMSNLLDSIDDGLDAISSFNFKALAKLCEGVTADEYDYLANAILYLDPQETKLLRSLSEDIVYEQLPVLNSLIGDEHVQNLFSQTSEVDLDDLKVSLKVSDETLKAVKTSSELLSVATQSSRLLLDCMLTYDHMTHLNEDGLESLNDYYNIYKKEYCTDCKYCSQIMVVSLDDIPNHKLEELEEKFGECEVWFYNKKNQEYLPEINCKKDCGNVPCDFMRSMQATTALYDDVDWKEDYIDYVATSFVNETVSFSLSNILEALPAVKFFSILNVGWQCMTEFVDGGTGVMDYYEAVGYIGPAYMLESDSLYFLKKYRSNYKTGDKLDNLKSLTYINLKSYYIANSELVTILSNSLNSKMRTSDLAKNRAQTLSNILAKFTLSDFMPSEYKKQSKKIIDSDALYQKVTGIVLGEDTDGNNEPVGRANVIFSTDGKEYNFITDSKGNIIDKKNSEDAYLPEEKYEMTIIANGYEKYQDKVKVKLKKECDLKKVILEMGERMPMIANFYVGSNFSNILNGGLITESSEYVYYCPSRWGYTFRYTKSDGTVMKLSEHGGNNLNVSSDEYLYVVDGEDEIWEINGLTGETRLVLKVKEWGENNFNGLGIKEIITMLLINDELYILFTGYTMNGIESTVLAVVNRESAQLVKVLQKWTADDLYLDFAFVGAENDIIYYSWKNAEQLYLYGCDVTNYEQFERSMCSENGSELNDARSYNATEFNNGYSYNALYYDVEFWDAVSENVLYSFNRTFNYGKYTVYDFFTDCYYEPEEPLKAINGVSNYKSVFIDGSLYILTYDNIIYRISEDLSDGEEFYSLKGEVDNDDNKIKFDDWEYGIADDAVWVIYPGCTLRLPLEGKISYIDVSNADKVENPYDNNIYGKVASNLIGVSGLYETPDVGSNLRIMNINNGTKVILLAKVKGAGNITYYRIRLEDETEGYMLASAIDVSDEYDAAFKVEEWMD